MVLPHGYWKINLGKAQTFRPPDSFVEHGTRNQILSQLGLDPKGLSNTVKQMMPLEERA